MTYEELLLEAESVGLIVKEMPLTAYNGRIKASRIYIKKDLLNVAKNVPLLKKLDIMKQQ